MIATVSRKLGEPSDCAYRLDALARAEHRALSTILFMLNATFAGKKFTLHASPRRHDRDSFCRNLLKKLISRIVWTLWHMRNIETCRPKHNICRQNVCAQKSKKQKTRSDKQTAKNKKQKAESRKQKTKSTKQKAKSTNNKNNSPSVTAIRCWRFFVVLPDGEL